MIEDILATTKETKVTLYTSERGNMVLRFFAGEDNPYRLYGRDFDGTRGALLCADNKVGMGGYLNTNIKVLGWS